MWSLLYDIHVNRKNFNHKELFSSSVDEHLNRDHFADHIAQGISSWWKLISNKQSGKLRAGALQLPRLKKATKKKEKVAGRSSSREIISKGKNIFDRKSEIYWDRTLMPLHFTELIYHSSVSIFSPPPSAKIKVISPTALTQRNDTKISSSWRIWRRGQTGLLNGLMFV